MKYIPILFAMVLLSVGCEETNQPFVLPEKYFPAYPESYWVYSNGQTVKIEPGYHKQPYQPEAGLPQSSDYVFVPKIDNNYIYKYSITQNSTVKPLKTLLKTVPGPAWIVNRWEGEDVYRKVVATAETVTLSRAIDNDNHNVFDSVIVVIEYIGAANEEVWTYRESYAPNVGMIKREINLSDSSAVPHTEMELVRYHINTDTPPESK